ncbi:MAG: nucleoside kinase [Clostridia bacterium]
MNNTVIVTFEDGKKVEVPYKTEAIDAIKLVQKDVGDILALRVNNEVKTYSYKLVKDSTIEYVKFQTDDGYRVYSRTLKMVLYMALTTLYSTADVEFLSTINRDQYFVIKNFELNEKKVNEIKAKMIEIIEKDLPIKRNSVSLEEATVLYTESNDLVKLQNMNNKLRSSVTIYFCDGMYNYFYGALAPSTGYIKGFNLLPYKEGALLIIPDDNMNINKTITDNRLYEAFISFDKLNDILDIGTVGQLNDKILKNRVVDVIQVAEAIHQRKLVELVLDIERKKNIKIVLIAGPSSSGKTTFAQKLGVQLKLTGYNPITLSMDNYFKERKDTPLGDDGKFNFECVEALDIELFNSQMRDLIDGKTVELPEFDFMLGAKKYNGNFLSLTSNDVLIIEGIHALNPILTKFTSDENKYRIYIAPVATLNIDGYTKVSSSDTRLLRRMVRDYTTRGHSVEKTLDLWNNVKRGEEKYIFPFVNTVDFIYNSSLVYEPSVMKTYAQPLLLQINSNSKFYSEARRLYEYLNNFLPMETTNIPIDSLVREFIGNGCFHR